MIHARPFDDPRNTYIVNNDDPGAFDKSHAGQPGTHNEQRCCGDKAPTRLPQHTGWYVDSSGKRIVQMLTYWAQPANAPLAASSGGWWNAPTPQGYFIETALTGQLMCDGCFGTVWDQFVDDVGSTFTAMVPVIRGIAMAISYIPVFGTAVSFLVNASVSLAQGASLDSALLDGVGGALPGQPVSGMAFNAARSLLNGDRIDQALIKGLPNPPINDTIKDILATLSDIAVAIARGNTITDVALDQLRKRLPEAGQAAMDVARRLANGESVQDVAVDEGMKAAASVAATGGAAAVNGYIAQAGFQASLDTLSDELQAAFKAGIIAGNAEQHQFIGTFDYAEKNVTTNDQYAAAGQKIVASGLYQGRPISDILKASEFAISRTDIDPLTGTPRTAVWQYQVNDGFKRGFLVALGLCEGKSADGPGQQQVRASLGNINAQHGFDAGQALQFVRTAGSLASVPKTTLVSSVLKGTSATLSATAAIAANKATDQKGLPSIALKTPVTVQADVYAQKTADRAKWVAYYKQLG